MANKFIHIIGGGTVYHVRNHLALSAPAYGTTARNLHKLCQNNTLDVVLHLTKMAGGKHLETNDDISSLLENLLASPSTKIIFSVCCFN